MFKHALAALVLAALVGAAPGQEKDKEYTLKFKTSPDKGQTFVVKEKETTTSDSKAEVNGMSFPETKKEVKDTEYELRVVKPGDKKPEEFTRTYAKATRSEGNRANKLSYDGRTLVFTLNKDDYKVKAEGDPAIPDKDLAPLAKDSKDPTELDPLMDPGKPVKVGDSWTPDAKKLEPLFGKDKLGIVDLDKSKVKGKLLKVYDKDKQQWGSIELTMEVVIKELTGEGAVLKLSEPAVVKFTLTIDRPIDGSSPASSAKGKMDVSLKATIDQNNMTIALTSAISKDIEGTITEKK